MSQVRDLCAMYAKYADVACVIEQHWPNDVLAHGTMHDFVAKCDHAKYHCTQRIVNAIRDNGTIAPGDADRISHAHCMLTVYDDLRAVGEEALHVVQQIDEWAHTLATLLHDDVEEDDLDDALYLEAERVCKAYVTNTRAV